MYRTDKQFMTNPTTASSRIYIGGLAKTVVATDLEDKFQAHGKILGLALQIGFAFIQYETESQAHAAIQNENNALVHGRKICVRQALDKSQKGGTPQNRRPGPPLKSNQPQLTQTSSTSSSAVSKEPNLKNQTSSQNTEAQKPPSFQSESEIPKLLQPSTEPPSLVEKQSNVMPKNKMVEMANNEPPPEKRPRIRPLNNRDRFQPPVDMYREEPYFGRDDYPPAKFNNCPPPLLDQPDRNDCEIIVVSKLLTSYAEYVEQRLKKLGLIVDLLFPNEDVPIGRVLANISSRGCLYAILIMPQNEEHRSLTLNVLHGVPQEHRNMPIEDACVFITRNFDAYMRGDKASVETLGPGGVMSVSDRHPTSMQLLLNLLAENRQITTTQYERLLKYLQDRREVQQNHEAEEGVDQTSQESNSKQAELQSRIMNILNKTATDIPIQPPPPPVAEVSQAADAAPPLLKDPSVQKALDSLLGGEMFKSIGAPI